MNQLRERVSRKGLGVVHLDDNRNPLGILAEQNETRLQDLVPVRIGRMLQSPFSFYRGTAAVMAADLKDAPTTDLDVVSCGDAHISNFGFYASPERALVFDLNDFDEGGLAPWEWDVRRLTASVYIGGRDIGLSEDHCLEAAWKAAEAYRVGMRRAKNASALDLYFVRADDRSLENLNKKSRKTVGSAAAKARGRTSEQVLRKLTTRSENGTIRIVDQPPILRHVDHASPEDFDRLFLDYRSTLREDIAYLLSQFTEVDHALRVVGVGSVGTRCYLIALEGQHGEALFLQAKEAQASVLNTYGGRPVTVPGLPPVTDYSEGHRVVAAQRILQASSDPFLGWIKGWAGDDTSRRRVDYYWRQFRDMKGSIEPSSLDRSQFGAYGEACATMLARAHAQSAERTVIAEYLGKNSAFADAMSKWSAGYADVAERDFEVLSDAVKRGRFPAEFGV